jgi:septum formation protein
VITGVAVWSGSNGKLLAGRRTTSVKFSKLTDRQITEYVATGEPMDVAGAYAIQGRGGVFIPHISGSFSNVVGLPLDLTAKLLRQAGALAPL